jgi:hypothetical protein
MSSTALVMNEPNKMVRLPPFYFRCTGCDTNMTSNTPANRYQIQKLIQKTVRTASSLYTMNLGSLNAYVKPSEKTYNVCWNQMSDRPVPSVQKATVPTGFYNSMNSRKHSVTSSKPGSQTPGGVGCDIKHNSYDRYLNRLKGKGPLRRGVIPPGFSSPYIPFNRALPVYGGKIMKTSIVNNCNCPITPKSNDAALYLNPYYQPLPDGKIIYHIGQYVYAIEDNTDYYSKALIIGIDESRSLYEIQFEDNVIQWVSYNDLKIYFNCKCIPDPILEQSLFVDQVCLYPNYADIKQII